MANELNIRNGLALPGIPNVSGSIETLNKRISTTNVDFEASTGANMLVNVSGSGGVSSQDANGSAETFKASGSLYNGQVVVYRYSGSSGEVRVGSPTTVPDQVDVAGIVLSDANNDDVVKVLTEGFVTVRRTTTYNATSETYYMPDNGTPPANNTRALTNDTTFIDAGSGSNYPSSQEYWVTFDVGSGTEHLVMNPTSFEFENSYSTDSRIYDRLSIKVSTDDVSFDDFGEGNTQTGIPWLQKMKGYVNGTTDSSKFPSDGDYDDAASKYGGTFPNLESHATTNNGSVAVTGTDWHITDDGTITGTRYRYVRFCFYSDSGTEENGWNITLKPSTPYSTPTTSVPAGALIYLDATDYTLLTTDSTSGRLIGKCIYDSPDNDSLLVRLIHAH